ncbi:hypothetical protein D3C77_663980 [compost metagenome]
MPQASGMPTQAQANSTSAMGVRKVDAPTPWVSAATARSCASAFSWASSSSVMKYLGLTGRIARLHRKPSTSMPARMYMVMSYTCARGTPIDSWYSRM